MTSSADFEARVKPGDIALAHFGKSHGGRKVIRYQAKVVVLKVTRKTFQVRLLEDVAALGAGYWLQVARYGSRHYSEGNRLAPIAI